MRWSALSHRDTRALLIGAAVIVLLGGLRGLPAWMDWRRTVIQSAVDRSLELRKARAAIAQAPLDLDSTEARITRFRELGPALFVTRDSSEAMEKLQAAIQDAARLSSVHVETMSTRVDSTANGLLLRVEASVSAASDVTGLASLLERLESHDALLALQKLSITPQSIETPQDAMETLALRFTVSARALVSAVASGPGEP